MTLTPFDIQNKEFSRSFRGYDEDEVNEFLDQIIIDYEKNIREKIELEAIVTEMQTRLRRFSDIEDTLNNALIVAQNAGDEVKKSAQKEAKLTITEAKKNADRIINDALLKSSKVAIEIEELKQQAKIFKSRIKMMIETQLEMINNKDWEKLFQYSSPKEKPTSSTFKIGQNKNHDQYGTDQEINQMQSDQADSWQTTSDEVFPKTVEVAKSAQENRTRENQDDQQGKEKHLRNSITGDEKLAEIVRKMNFSSETYQDGIDDKEDIQRSLYENTYEDQENHVDYNPYDQNYFPEEDHYTNRQSQDFSTNQSDSIQDKLSLLQEKLGDIKKVTENPDDLAHRSEPVSSDYTNHTSDDYTLDLDYEQSDDDPFTDYAEKLRRAEEELKRIKASLNNN